MIDASISGRLHGTPKSRTAEKPAQDADFNDDLPGVA